MGKKQITLEDAIKALKEEYEKAKRSEFVRKPLSFALYQTWKKIDGKENENDSP